METQICTKCSTEKPLSEYYILKSKTGGKDYLYKYCKKCHYHKMTKKTAKKWRQDYPDKWRHASKMSQRAWLGRQDAGVYLIFTTKGLYVGQSDHIKSRIQEHKLSKRKGCIGYYGAKYLFHVVLEYEDNKKRRLEIEKSYITILKPKLNIRHNTRKRH